MSAARRHARGPLVATSVLAAGTLAVAALAAGSAEGVASTAAAVAGRVAPDWLAVAAALVVAERSLSFDRGVTDRALGALALAVFLGGVAVAVRPVAVRAFGPDALGSAAFVTGVAAAVRGALFPTGLFLGTVAGLTTARRTDGGPPHLVRLSPRVLGRTLRPLGVLAAASAGLIVATKLALGGDYPAFVVADATVAALTGLATYGVLAVGLVAVAGGECGIGRALAGTAAVWVLSFVAALAVAAIGGVAGALLVTATATPVPVVERSTLAYWPSPHSRTMLLGAGTFLAGAVGFLTVRRSGGPAGASALPGSSSGSDSTASTDPNERRQSKEPREPSANAGEPGETR